MRALLLAFLFTAGAGALPQTQIAQIKRLRGVLNNIFYVIFIIYYQ
ncbi:hypothetical protein ACSLNH_01485 [Comamonas kerstersii]